MNRKISSLAKKNAKLAKGKWSDEIGKHHLQILRTLTENYGFAIALGDLLLLGGRWYVTHAGLLHLASRRKCRGISTFLQERLCDPDSNRWVFRAVVYKGAKSGFTGFGDASPASVSPW